MKLERVIIVGGQGAVKNHDDILRKRGSESSVHHGRESIRFALNEADLDGVILAESILSVFRDL